MVAFLKMYCKFLEGEDSRACWYTVSEFTVPVSSDVLALTGSLWEFNNVDVNETIYNLISLTKFRGGIKLHLINSNVLVTVFALSDSICIYIFNQVLLFYLFVVFTDLNLAFEV